MTTVNDIYGGTGSQYLRAADLAKKSVTLVPKAWETVEFEETNRSGEKYQAKKIVIFFEGKDKGWVVNKTNAKAMEYAYGPSPDEWIGKKIELYPTLVSFADQRVEAIRVRPVIETALDDEIPF